MRRTPPMPAEQRPRPNTRVANTSGPTENQKRSMANTHHEGNRLTRTKTKKNALDLRVNVFSTKVLTGDTIFTSPNGDGAAILRGHRSHVKVSLLAVQRKYLHFSVIFKTLSNGPALGIKLVTSRFAVKRSTD